MSTEVSFSQNIYSLDTIKRAAYRFSDQFSFNFDMRDDKIFCTITAISKLDDTFDISGAFQNEVLDQDLRHRIAAETATTRNLILAHVFSNTGLQSVE